MSPGLSLEHFFLLVGLFVAAVAVRLAGNPAHPRRWGSAGFWLLLAITIGAGKYLPAELVGWMVLAMGLLVATKQVAAPYFPDGGAERQARAEHLGNRVLWPILLVPGVAIAGSFVVGNTTYTTLISEEISMGVPVWSPDGSRIAAARSIMRWYSYPPPESGITPGFRLIEANVVTIPASGGYASLITSDINPSPFLDATVRRNTPGSWSADGRLFYTKTRGASVPVAEQGTYVFPGSGPATKINGFVGSSLQWTALNQSGVAVEIQLPKLRFRTGESFDATVQVTSREDSTQRVSFVETLLKSEDSGVLRVGAVELPTPFDLTPLNWRRAFTVPVVATNEGVTELVSRISVAGPTGPAQELTARLAVKVFPAGDLLIKRAK